MNAKPKKVARKPFGKRLVESMREVADALESGRPLEEQLTVRVVEVRQPPPRRTKRR